MAVRVNSDFYTALGSAPSEASFIQEVKFLRRQGLASQRQSSLASCQATNMTKRRQSDRQAPTQVKRLSLDKVMMQRPTVFLIGKAPVSAGHGDCAGDAAGVEERGMPGDGWMKELGKPIVVSRHE